VTRDVNVSKVEMGEEEKESKKMRWVVGQIYLS
jgi:hypothetical protein